MDTENAVSLDLSVRKKYGRVTGSVGGYYYHFEDYINLQPTGAIDAGSGLDVYEYSAVGAEFYGLELETTVHLLAPLEEETSRDHFLDLIFRADYVHAEDHSSGQPIPRIAPLRIGTSLEYGNGPWLARIDGDYNADQNRNATFETETDSFFLLATSLSYDLQLGPVNSTLFLRGVNLTNEEARLSTSFLKNNAPLAGRGVIVGMNTTF
jgi:iron complex outermembrane receptor protein